jgi:hypothetical protein
MCGKEISPDLVVEEWRHHGIALEEEPETMANFLPTIGKWFHNRLAAINAKGLDFKKTAFEQPTLAFHASSIEQAAETIRSRGLRVGVCASDDAPGIYCEREKRLANVLIYATHTLLHAHPTLATTTVFELCVDRAHQHGERRVVNGQWVQQEHNVFIVGVYTHIFPIAKLYTTGYYGWYRIHNSVFETLQDLQVDEDGEPLTAEELARRGQDMENDV